MATASTNRPDSAPEPNLELAPDQVTDRPIAPKLVSDSIATGVVFALLLTAGQKVIGFVRGILFCKYMSDQELGQWSMVWSFLMLLAPLAALGLPGCFGRFSEHYRQRGQLKTFITRIAACSVVTTMTLAIVIISAPAFFSKIIFGSTIQQDVVIALGIAIIAVSLSNFLASLMKSIRQVRIVTAMRFITGVMFAVVGTMMIMTWNDSAAGAAIAYAIACMMGAIPAVFILWKFRADIANDGDCLGHVEMWKRIAPFAMWLWATNLCHNFFEVSDRTMLIHWSTFSPEVAQGFVGQYHSGRVVPLLLVSVATILGGVLMPYMSAQLESGKPEKAMQQLNWAIKLVAISFTAGGILMLLMAPILFDWILESRYNDGLNVLPLTLVYCIWFCIFVVGQNYLWVAEKGKFAALATLVGLVANVGLNMLLIPILELQGAVIATTLGNAFAVMLILGFNHHFGCRWTAGIWISVAAPLMILMPMPVAMLAVTVLTVVAWKSNLLFSSEEKQMAIAECKKFINQRRATR